MEAQTLATEARTPDGKGAARELRRAGKVPAVLYGNQGDALALSVSPKELRAVLSTEHRRNQLINLTVDGTEQLALVQELQVHPVTRAPLHVDFIRVSADQAVDRSVPLTTSGRAVGVVAGGDLRVLYRFLPVSSPPHKVPAAIHINVTPLKIGDVIAVKDLELEEGVRVSLPEERNLVTVTQSRRRVAQDGEDEGEAKAS